MRKKTDGAGKGYGDSFWFIRGRFQIILAAMNRRTFLLHSAGLAAAGLWSRSLARAQTSGPSTGATGAAPADAKPVAAPPPPGPPITEFKPLRRHAGYFTGRGGTIGWLASSSALVVVDTQFPDTAAACFAGLPGRGGRTLDVVLNTHHHFDHTRDRKAHV